jgi:hypothetical protein
MQNAGWCLNSTNGYSQLTCEFVAVRGSSLVHNVRLEQRTPTSEPGSTVAIASLSISSGALAQLVTVLQAWLAQSLRGLALNPLDYLTDLAVNPDESLKLTFGASAADTITTSGTMSVSVEVRRNSLSGVVAFATDPTCLQLLSDGVKRLLATARAG